MSRPVPEPDGKRDASTTPTNGLLALRRRCDPHEGLRISGAPAGFSSAKESDKWLRVRSAEDISHDAQGQVQRKVKRRRGILPLERALDIVEHRSHSPRHGCPIAYARRSSSAYGLVIPADAFQDVHTRREAKGEDATDAPT